MTERENFIRETNNLIAFYKDKKSNVRDYIKTVCLYSEKLDDLRIRNIHDLVSQVEENSMFIEIICFYTNIELSNLASLTRQGEFMIIFDPMFMEYFLTHKKEIKKRLDLEGMCELQYKYRGLQIKMMADKGIFEDFNQKIGKNITLKELWKS